MSPREFESPPRRPERRLGPEQIWLARIVSRSKEIVAYAASFTGPVAGNAFLAMVGVLTDEWGASEATVLLAIPAFMVPFAVLQIFSGVLSTAYDRRLTLSLGLLVYIGGSLGAAASPSLAVFLATRVVQGVGYAFVAPVLVPIVSDVAGKDRQGLAMGYLGSTGTAGVTVGPLMGGLFAEMNWRLAFLAIAALAGVVLLAVVVVFRHEPRVARERAPKELWSQLASTLGNRDIVLLSATGFAAFASFAGIISFLSVHLDAQLAMSSGEIGFVLMFSGLSGVFLSPVAGKLVDARGTRCCVALGFGVAAAAALALQAASDMYLFGALLAAMGLGSSFVWSALLTMLMRTSPSGKDASSSVFNSARFMGFALAPVFMAPIYNSAGFDAIVVVCAAVNIGCIALALSTRKALDR